MSTLTGPAQRHAVLGGAPGHMGRAHAGDERLGRGAAVVDAGAAVVFAFDQRDLQAGLRQTHSQKGPGLAAADDDGVVRLHRAFT